jgi:two-component system, NarL family, response regulator DesR
MARGLRVLYVENDEALLGLLGQSLRVHPKIASITTAKNSSEALAAMTKETFDAALLDVSLGAGSLTGVELGIELRERNEHLGIVLLSQHISTDYLASMPVHFGYGWSAIQKSANLSFEYLVQVLESTAMGLNVFEPTSTQKLPEHSNLSATLNKRQLQIIALAATGIDANEISKQLELAAVTVRQELSKIYKVLVPEPKPGTDLRTVAVLRYLRDTRSKLD